MTAEPRIPEAMPLDEFWQLTDAARAGVTTQWPFADCLADLLAARSRKTIVAYERTFTELQGDLNRWEVRAAAWLVVGGSLDDDAFLDFRAGVISLGRAWYERVTASPDSLAEHPVAQGGRPELLEDLLFDEEANFAVAKAFPRAPGDEDYDELTEGSDQDEGLDRLAMEEPFDLDDEEAIRRGLPALAALFPG